ncbi:MAG TPA: TIGR00730 family Rossman fold protein [Verrucomicrobiae bacterium]|nr:TIGR00730 family Rossman fold protein [Verrucomicrobiae bacterium]
MRICVFCGSSSGNRDRYAEAARQAGKLLAERGIELVYGGAHRGLMGVVADAVLEAGGTVIGVIPQALADREIQHTGLTQLHVVGSMHERKTKMAELSDGFIALPGGTGTLEEIFEQWAWGQLDIHSKPCGFLNTLGYYDPLRQMIDRMIGEGFLRAEHASMLVFDEDPGAILRRFEEYVHPTPKWRGTANG